MGFCELRSDTQQARICKAMDCKGTIKFLQSKAFEIVAKGQLISKWLFDILKFPKKQHKNLMNFWNELTFK